MTRRAELLALAVRVENGETGGNIDGAISRPIGWSIKYDGMELEFWRDSAGNIHSESSAYWTSSIDAQAALPGRIIEMIWASDEPDGPADCNAYAYREFRPGVPLPSGRAPTEAAARLAALLRAMAEDAA